MKSIFINKSGQVRSGWKISLCLIVGIIMVIGLQILFRMVLPKNSFSMFLFRLTMPLSILGATFFVLKVVDKKKAKDIGLASYKEYHKDFLTGLVMGTVSLTVIFFALLAYGAYSLENSLSQPNITGDIITSLVLYIFVGFAEEIFGRGYCMTVLWQTGNKWIVVIVSSILFSLLHGGNPNVGIVALINTFLVGVLFAYMFLKTKSIWLPIGFHIAWNFFQGPVYGFAVSGGEGTSVYKVKLIKDNLVTGGAYGPEAGLIGTALILLGFIFIWMYYPKGTLDNPIKMSNTRVSVK
ncbi:MAG: CPBP family intramembrane metalloprotease [Clostridia bacterium]|nr:CPBP family intramembrane metalloprotease [Clostridia bacterium]